MSLGAVFAVYYAAALILVAMDLRASDKRRAQTPVRVWSVPATILLLASYCAQLAIVWYAATHQRFDASQAWRSALPFPVITLKMEHPDAVAALIIAIGVAQCALLWAVYRNPPKATYLWIAATAFLALSLAEPALISFDPYSYAADAFLGQGSYGVVNASLPDPYRVVNQAFAGSAVPRSPYGPLWLLLSQGVSLPLPTLFFKTMAFRAIGALSLAGLVAALWTLYRSTRICALAALNPALYLQYVMNGHNDLFATACVAWAAAIVKRSAAGAVLLLVAAACVKLPFALLGLPVLASIPVIRTRAVAALSTIAASLAVSWFAAGAGYFRAIFVHLPSFDAFRALGAAVAAAAVVVLIDGVARSRRYNAAAWLFPLAGSYPTSWYGIWGLGYALARQGAVAYLLIFLPLFAALIDVMFIRIWTIEFVVPAVMACCLLSAYAGRSAVR
jgi:hypothetical protein